jgi:hypothetical protein
VGEEKRQEAFAREVREKAKRSAAICAPQLPRCRKFVVVMTTEVLKYHSAKKLFGAVILLKA